MAQASPAYRLYEDGDRVLISRGEAQHAAGKSAPLSAPGGWLTIDRRTGNGRVGDDESVRPSVHSKGRDVYGLIGVVHLLSGPYLMLISQASHVGRLLKHHAWRVDAVELMPLVPANRATLSAQQAADEDRYCGMLINVYASRSFFFCVDGWDMTKHVRCLNSREPVKPADSFYWNRQHAQQLGVAEEWKWAVPLVRGFLSISHIELNNTPITYVVLSRQSRYRAGTRFNRRGVDDDGQVANFVETEQIVVAGDEDVMSFVQTRGSIPLFWEQVANLKLKPQPTMQDVDPQLHFNAFRRHMEAHVEHYGPTTAVNLVDTKKAEGVLADEFQRLVKRLGHQHLSYHHFDFHTECAKMRYDRLSKLVDAVRVQLQEYGYSHFTSSNNEMQKVQHGVFRVNCIDCLDRTNVVQSVFAREVLHAQLVAVNVIRPSDVIADLSPLFESILKTTWADNADQISLLYAGSGALKTDFTRTGKRSLMGMVNDGVNTLQRYYLQNFRDGYRQDAISLAVGDTVINPDEHPRTSTPLREASLWPLLMFILGLGVLMVVANLFVAPLANIGRGANFVFGLLWVGVTIALVVGTLRNGRDYVDRPKFVSLPRKRRRT